MNNTIFYEVKKATTADSAAIIKILKDRATLLKEQGSTQWNFLLTGLEDEEIVRNVEAGLFYKVVDPTGGNTVATFLLSRAQDEWDVNLWGKEDGNDGSIVYLHKLAVSVDRKGAHVGDFMMHWIKDQSKSMQVDTIRLDCVAYSSYLRPFYEKHGFILVKEVHDHYLFEWHVH
ncbi:GNAT family N-acetyltransferase [Bacillus haimaensis]|uniref:GNAT family N-acetyltransferase n=1 Tax=Bacillus haimaensis TaxID=3160967 RepID=UPI003AA96409